MTLQFRFYHALGPGGVFHPVARQFVGLLHQHGCWRVLTLLQHSSVAVTVHFAYHSELERTHQLDQVFWLLELSERAEGPVAARPAS